MAYEFKKLSDVAVVETPADTANVLIEEDGVIKKVAKDEVGGAGGLEVASTAEVGQTIIVKAVDENGKPTEWECADLDLFITFDSSAFREDNPSYHVVLAATNNLYEKIQQMYNNHRYRDITLYNVTTSVDFPTEIYKYSCNRLRAPHDGGGWYIDCGTFTATVYPNNLIDVQYYD